MMKTPKNKEYWEFLDGTETNQSYCAILRELTQRNVQRRRDIHMTNRQKSTKHGSYVIAMGIRKGFPETGHYYREKVTN